MMMMMNLVQDSIINIPPPQQQHYQKPAAQPKPFQMNDQVCIADLLPFIIPFLDQTKATHIHNLFLKRKNDQISKNDFADQFRGIVGIQLLRQAMIRNLQLRDQREQDVVVVPSQSSQTQMRNNQFQFSELLPFISPYVDRDQQIKIQAIYLKLKNNQIQKPEFLGALRRIVGDGMLRDAIQRLEQHKKTVQEESSIRQAPPPQKQGEGIVLQTTLPNNQNCSNSNSRKVASHPITATPTTVTMPADQWNFMRPMPNPAPSLVGQKKKRLDAPPPSLPNKKQKVDTIEQLPKKDSQKKQAMEVKKHQNVKKAGEKTSNEQEPREIKATTANLEAMLKWQQMAEDAQKKRGGSMVANQTCPTITDLPTMAESSKRITEREPQEQPTIGTESQIEETESENEDEELVMFLENELESGEPSCTSQPDNIPEPSCAPQQPEENDEDEELVMFLENEVESGEPSCASQPDNIPEPSCAPQQPEEDDGVDMEPIFQHLYDQKEDHLPEFSEDVYYLDDENFQRELAAFCGTCV